MIHKEEALLTLFGDSKYNFVDLLHNVSSCYLTESPDVRQIINTVELFAFGSWLHYIQYEDRFIQLPPEGIRKLAKLTIISICNENEGGSVQISELLSELEGALESQKTGLKTATQGGSVHTGVSNEHQQTDSNGAQQALEELLSLMVDERLIEARINERSHTVKFLASHTQRDAYNSTNTELHVLTEKDIPKRSVSQAHAILQRWIEQHIARAREQLQEY